ncbi:hypothetical protein EIP86_009824 [Pleurotus ostreatoroseus]|nr:hypothetical protein EIP86_009824 [Pleurotus ostreatoroseus]
MLQNVPLLYQSVPELKDILALFDISIDTPVEALETHELRARFESLVEGVFAVLAETRLFALFLDDLQEAPDSSLDLIKALINSRSRIFDLTSRRYFLVNFGMMELISRSREVLDVLRSTFSSRAATWINLEPLSFTAISTMVSRTLHRPKEEVQSLSRVIHAASLGNAFSARNILTTLHRQHMITYDWEKNYWDYKIEAIEASMADKKAESDPNDISYLIAHLRELPEDARKYLIWASFFGSSFKVTDVALMMDWEDSSGSSSDEDTDSMWNFPKSMRGETALSTTRGSMRGLQIAIQEGWLVQRARDMCSFAHDRYRQAAQAEAQHLPEGAIPKMSFRIILMMLHEPAPDVYRIAEHAKRCLPLLREHQKRDELLDLSIDAGDSAAARGAHEASGLLALQSYLNALSLLDENPWKTNPRRTMALYLKLAELSTWKGQYERSDAYIEECLAKTSDPEMRAQIMRIRARNHFMRQNYDAALTDTIFGLHLLGVDVNPAPTRREADTMFEQVKNEILAVGFDDILNIPRARDQKTDLAISLLNDAGRDSSFDSYDFILMT